MKRTFDETTLGIDYLYYTSTLLCSATNNVAANNTEIYCPFIPDTISIHMCAQGLPDEKSGVVTFNAYSQLGAVADSSTAAVALQTVVSHHSDRIPKGVVVPDDKRTVVSQRMKWSVGYDPNAAYVPRSQRPEWLVIGLLGQIPIKNNEYINPNWILIGNISDGTVAKKYLVR